MIPHLYKRTHDLAVCGGRGALRRHSACGSAGSGLPARGQRAAAVCLASARRQVAPGRDGEGLPALASGIVYHAAADDSYNELRAIMEGKEQVYLPLPVASQIGAIRRCHLKRLECYHPPARSRPIRWRDARGREGVEATRHLYILLRAARRWGRRCAARPRRRGDLGRISAPAHPTLASPPLRRPQCDRVPPSWAAPVSMHNLLRLFTYTALEC